VEGVVGSVVVNGNEWEKVWEKLERVEKIGEDEES